MDDMKTLPRMDAIPPTFGRARIIKNLIVMSLSMMLIFTAYDGLSMLQSTMNKEHSIGTISQAVVYISFCLSSLTLSKYAIKKLGCKVIYLIAITLFLPYIAANFYPCWGTMMPSAMVLGIGSAMIWAAQAGYFNACVHLYCSVEESVTKGKANQNPATICDGPFTEKLSNGNSNITAVDVLSRGNLPCVEGHSENYSNCKCVAIPNTSKCLAEEIPSGYTYDCPSAKSYKCICIDVSNSHSKTVKESKDKSACVSDKRKSEHNSKCLCAFSGDDSNTICREISSEKNSKRKSLDFITDSDNSVIDVLSENDYNYLHENKLPVTESVCNISKTHSTINYNDFEGENFASTENLLAKSFNGNSTGSFAAHNSKQQRQGVFSVINPNYFNSDDNSNNMNSQSDLRYPFESNVSSNHTSEHLNYGNFRSPFSIKTFKGEITPVICERRSRCLNKRKLTVRITHDTKENFPEFLDSDKSNSFSRCEANSELKVEDLESLYNHTVKTNFVNDADIQCEPEVHRKSAGGAEVKGNILKIESITARFFGSNGLSFHSAQIWSNLVSYYVLQNNSVSNSPMCSYSCGASYCNAEPDCQIESSKEPSNGQMRYVLTGIYIMLGMAAIFLVLFLLDPVQNSEKQSVKFSFHNLLATFNHCKKGIQVCLIPMSLYIGMIQGFYTADFTKSYIACALGNSHVGLVTVYYGLACALSSTLSGYLVKFTGRIRIFLLMQVANLAVNAILLVWTPDPTLPVIFYLAAGLLGVVTGTLWSQIPAFYSILFKKDEEAAFASYYVFNSLGWLLSFAYSDYLCTSVKIYILIIMSSLGVLGYLVAERLYRARKNKLGLAFA